MIILDPRLAFGTTSESQSYLLLQWRNEPDEPWQYMLEQIGTGERRLFNTLDELTRFLAQQPASSGQSATNGSAKHP